jgi:hypothetical protein
MKLLNKYKAYLLVVYAFFILLHFFIKEYFHPLSILFYATPLILIIVFGLIITCFYYKTKPFYIIIIIQIIFISFWFKNNLYFNSTKAQRQNYKTILFWNLAKKKTFPKVVIESEIKNHHPEVLAFVEDKSDFLKNKDSISGYSYKRLVDNMSVLYKGELLDVKFYYNEENYKLNLVTIKYKNKVSTYLIVDVYADPFTNKAEAHKVITKLANDNNIDVVLGDFNTPFESVFFEDYKTNYNSLRTKSNGFTATWFYGLPLLELDQIWLNKTHETLLLEKRQYSNSDHKLLIATYLQH